MNAHDIIIGGLRIAFDSAYGLTQTYEEIGGSIVHRMLDGSAVKQQHWSKLRTVIEGRGRIPPGLESLDYTASIVIDCMAPIALANTSNNVFALPTARRTDWAPAGYAIVSGRLVRSICTVVANTATVGIVSGAQGYQVLYWPKLTVLAGRPQQGYDGRAAEGSWTLTAEEV